MASSSPSTWTTTRPRRSTRACSRRCCRTSPRSSATRRAAATPSAGRPRRPSRTRASRSPSSIGAESEKEIVFTSGATESDNLAHQGRRRVLQGARATTSSRRVIEHKAVLDTCKRLEKQGFQVTYLARRQGRPRRPGRRRSRDHRQDDPRLDHARQQRGRHGPADRGDRQDHARAAACSSTPTRCRASARSPFDVEAMNVDLASITAHKMYGPKGVGALYVRRSKPRVRLVGADGRRRPRARHALGHAERPGHRRLRQGRARSRARSGAEDAERIFALRERLRTKLMREARRGAPQRLAASTACPAT